MDLYEYQGKQYFARYGIPTSPGGVADTVDEAVAQADAAGYPVVVKAQVKVGGRGKAGGIKLADDADEVRTHAGAILGMDIKGHVVQRLWVEHASDIAREYYASFTLDRAAKLHLGMVSAKGGVEIEEVAATNPDAIARLHVDPVDGLSLEAAAPRWWPRPSSTSRPGRRRRRSCVTLYRCYVEGDCDLAEINPLILTTDGRVHALDAKVTLDDNAAFRHPEWEEFAGDRDRRRARAAGQGEGAQLHRPVGLGRHHRQRRRARDEHARRRHPGRRARRPTSSTSAAAPTPTSWPPPSRSSTPTPTCGRSSSTSSAASPGCDEVANGHRRGARARRHRARPSCCASTGPTPRRAARMLAPHLSDRWSWTTTMLDAARRAVALAGGDK